MDCSECRKRVCTDCFRRLSQLKCPFCRSWYTNQDDAMEIDVPSLERQDQYITNDDADAFIELDPTLSYIERRFVHEYKEQLRECVRNIVSSFYRNIHDGVDTFDDMERLLHHINENSFIEYYIPPHESEIIDEPQCVLQFIDHFKSIRRRVLANKLEQYIQVERLSIEDIMDLNHLAIRLQQTL